MLPEENGVYQIRYMTRGKDVVWHIDPDIQGWSAARERLWELEVRGLDPVAFRPGSSDMIRRRDVEGR